MLPARAILTSAPSRATVAASLILVSTPPVVSCAAALVSRDSTASPCWVKALAPQGRLQLTSELLLLLAPPSAALPGSAVWRLAASTCSRLISCAPGCSGGRSYMPSTLVCDAAWQGGRIAVGIGGLAEQGAASHPPHL